MSSLISYSCGVDLQQHNRNPKSTSPQEDQELAPFFQNLPSPFDDDTQQPNLGLISDKPLPRINITNTDTTRDISNNNSTQNDHSRPSDYYCSKMKKSNSRKGSTARKSGKKDRHSKIYTAQGLRDRRMRLSVQSARQFFDLQDMLGYDKASKTIEWLFSKSKKAIKQLSCSASNVPQINCDINVLQKGSKCGDKAEQKRKVNQAAASEVSCHKTCHKSLTSETTNYHIAKELRDKARARARERTREKRKARCLEKSIFDSSSDQAAYNLSQLGPAHEYHNSFEIGQQSMSTSSSHQDNILTSQSSSLHRRLAGMELLSTTASSSESMSCSTYKYQDDTNGDLFSGGLDFYLDNLCYSTGNWDSTGYEYSNPNSINLLEDSGYQFQYSDQNQVD